MPPLAPHKSSLHRHATLSLYRSLLRSATHVGESTCPTSAETLRALIRYRFTKDRVILSRIQAKNGIEAGYGFLGLLRGCVAGQAGALERLNRTLETVAIRAEQTAIYRREVASRWKPPPESRHKHLRNLRLVKTKNEQVTAPVPSSTPTSTSTPATKTTPRIFTHPAPLSSVKSGVRKVPNLILAHGIPLLKYPGPTPVVLNRVLKEKILWGVRKWDQFKEIEGLVRIAEMEDEWDGILARRAGISMDGDVDDGERNEESYSPGFVVRPRYYDPQSASFQQHVPVSKPRISWTTHLKEEGRAVQLAVMDRGKKYALLGDRYFHEVIVKERDLKEQERKEGKQARRMARKQAAGIFGSDGEIAEEDVEPSSVASGFI